VPQEQRRHVLATVLFTDIAVASGALWVSNCPGTVSRVDLATRTAQLIDVDIPVTITGLAGSSPHPGTLTGCPDSITTAFGSVWAADVANGAVYRIDPDTDDVDATIRIGEGSGAFADGIAEASGSIWVTSPKDQTVVRIDPATNQIVQTIPLPYTPNGLAVGGDGSVWVSLAPPDS
jgi:hypothetical protein